MFKNSVLNEAIGRGKYWFLGPYKLILANTKDWNCVYYESDLWKWIGNNMSFNLHRNC